MKKEKVRGSRQGFPSGVPVRGWGWPRVAEASAGLSPLQRAQPVTEGSARYNILEPVLRSWIREGQSCVLVEDDNLGIALRRPTLSVPGRKRAA